jgi:uroporphyrinogen decarboxylase
LNQTLNSRELVKTVISKGPGFGLPKGELCIDDQVFINLSGCAQPGFEERLGVLESLSLDLVSLSPEYPSGRLPEVSEYLWPDLNLWVTATSYFTFAVLDGAFEWGMRVLGLQKFFSMLKESPLSVKEFIGRVDKLNLATAEKLVAEGIDGIILADDIAYQSGLFVSPKTLRDAFIPSLALQAGFVRSSGLPVFFHSDGDYRTVIEDIVGAGFQGLQCLEKGAGMNMEILREQFGPEICFWGHLDVNDIKEANSEESCIKLLESIRLTASQGSFILGTTSGLFTGIDLDVLRSVYRAL